MPAGTPGDSILVPRSDAELTTRALEVYVVAVAAVIDKTDFELNHSYFRESTSISLAD